MNINFFDNIKDDINPIRILHVFGRLDRAGAETMIMNIYKKINRNEIQFDFIIHTEDKCEYEEEIKELGGRIFRAPKYTGKNHFKYIHFWNDFFKKNIEYKIIHGHVRSTASIYLEIAKKYNVVTIAHSHSTSSGKGISGFVKYLFQLPIRYKADYLLACSNAAGKWLYGKKAMRKKNFLIFNNSIDLQKFTFDKDKRDEIKGKFNINEDFVVGHVGRFHPSKNHSFIIDVFYEISKIKSSSILILIGEGELRQEVEEKVKEFGLSDKVLFLGSRDDTYDLLQVMDVFLFPSLYEGLGMSLVEAQAAGLPCVTSKEIPLEALITDNVKKLSLNESSSEWATNVLSYSKEFHRTSSIKKIKNSGFDVTDNTKILKEFYLKIF